MKDSYIIYKAVDDKGFLSIKELIDQDTTITPKDKEEFLKSLIKASTSASGGAKKSSKKNNLKTKNRRNKLSKRKTLKRITRKIKRT